MKTFKAILVLILIYAILLFGAFQTELIEPEYISLANDYARITDVDYKAIMLDNEDAGGGKALIKEIITFDVHAASENNLYSLISLQSLKICMNFLQSSSSSNIC